MNLHKLSILGILIGATFSVSAQCWNLVFEDDFDGTNLDLTKWSYQTGAGGWGNNELQYYTDRTDNVSVSGGYLSIMALEESYMGASYTSGRIHTKNKADWTYGRMEARIKIPETQGIWPAFWMLPTQNVYGGWPASGEIDIMEALGHIPETYFTSLHYGTSGDHQYQSTSYTLPVGDFADDYHVFSIYYQYLTLTLMFVGLLQKRL